MISPLLEDESIIGCQPLWFRYSPNDKFFDRYCTLFGITDPLTIYLEKRSALMLWEKKWQIGTIKEKNNYFVAEFNKQNLPTIGSVGFTIKKDHLLKTNYDPAFSHLDCIQDLLKIGLNRFAMVKGDIIHLHSISFRDFVNKLKRNFNIFIRDFDKRRYKWDSSISKKISAVFTMVTFIIPSYHSIRGYFKIKDRAWLIHPFVCFIIISLYLKILFSWKLNNVKNHPLK